MPAPGRGYGELMPLKAACHLASNIKAVSIQKSRSVTHDKVSCGPDRPGQGSDHPYRGAGGRARDLAGGIAAGVRRKSPGGDPGIAAHPAAELCAAGKARL